MSASIIQRKAAFAQQTGSGTVAVTLDSTISAGSTLVIAAALVQSDGGGTFAPTVSAEDDLSNSYAMTGYNSSGSSFFANTYQSTVTPQAGARTYTLSFTAPGGQSGYSFLAGICVYELSGVSVIPTSESASQSLSSFHKMSDLSATISGLSGGTYGNLLVSIFAGLFSTPGVLTDANQVTAGSGWTLDGRDAVNGTFDPMVICFESQLVGPSSNPAAVFGGDSNTTELDGTILVAAYSLTAALPGGGGGVTTVPFLGSVSETTDDSLGTQYIGHVKVIASAPAGVPNPYLGKIEVVGSAPAGVSDPLLGEVVIVADQPGSNDVYLGHIEEV
jgi:hypothetical protein